MGGSDESEESGNDFDFDCDWRFAFKTDAGSKGTVGYLLSWSGCGGLNLRKDIQVRNPFNATGQTIVSGTSITCVGVLESMRYEGGAEDPIRLVAYVSKAVAGDVRAKLARPLTSTKIQLSFYIVSYDEDEKKWFEMVYIKDQATVDANLDTTGGEVQCFIDSRPTRVDEALDLKVYKLEFQVVPADGASAVIEFAEGPTQRVVKSWGAESS